MKTRLGVACAATCVMIGCATPPTEALAPSQGVTFAPPSFYPGSLIEGTVTPNPNDLGVVRTTQTSTAPSVAPTMAVSLPPGGDVLPSAAPTPMPSYLNPLPLEEGKEYGAEYGLRFLDDGDGWERFTAWGLAPGRDRKGTVYIQLALNGNNSTQLFELKAGERLVYRRSVEVLCPTVTLCSDNLKARAPGISVGGFFNEEGEWWIPDFHPASPKRDELVTADKEQEEVHLNNAHFWTSIGMDPPDAKAWEEWRSGHLARGKDHVFSFYLGRIYYMKIDDPAQEWKETSVPMPELFPLEHRRNMGQKDRDPLTRIDDWRYAQKVGFMTGKAPGTQEYHLYIQKDFDLYRIREQDLVSR